VRLPPVMSGIFDSSRGTQRPSIFGSDDDDDNHDPFGSPPHNNISSSSTITNTKNTAAIDSHPSPSAALSSSRNIAGLASPGALQQPHFSTPPQPLLDAPPAYDTPTPAATITRTTPQPSGPSFDSPAADPWSSTPRTNGAVPVAVQNFPPAMSARRPTLEALGRSDTASYLLDADHITIQKADEKEGIIGFKHVNYTLGSARRGTQVVRRYSDFAWLYDALVKRYPFRQVPLLPPKRLAGISLFSLKGGLVRLILKLMVIIFRQKRISWNVEGED
jgi:hypothetical protein